MAALWQQLDDVELYMPGQSMTYDKWYSLVQHYTKRLVHISSVSPGEGENQVAQEVLQLLCDDGVESIYAAVGLDPIENDLYQRQNAYAFLRGESPYTIVLLGHIDTVGTQDYGPLEPYALDPDALVAHLDTLIELTPELREDVNVHSGDWMFGRGTADMKSGVAVNIAVMRYLARQASQGELALSIVMLATRDEENESAGVLQAVRFLLRLREQYGLNYIGAINTDYTTSLYPGDPHRYVYTGTIGKLLPSFLIIGRESHVGDPFDGLDANLLAAELIRNLSMSDDLCDSVRGQIAPPPVTLHATDLKSHYDVQLPFAAYFYLNMLTLTSGPDVLLERLCHYAERTLAQLLERIDATERRWLRAGGNAARAEQLQPRSGIVLTYAELYSEAVQRLGGEFVTRELDMEWKRWPAELDKRERCLHLVYRLWTLSGKAGPAVVIYYSPPYYPYVAPSPCVLHDATTALVKAHPEINLMQEEQFPFLSDISYLRIEEDLDLSVLKANMPVWQEADAPPHPGSYTLPLEAIRELDLPFINFGAYGRGAHQRGERVLMSYSFGVLPQLVYELIENVARLVEQK